MLDFTVSTVTASPRKPEVRNIPKKTKKMVKPKPPVFPKQKSINSSMSMQVLNETVLLPL